MVTGVVSGELYCGGAWGPDSKKEATDYGSMRKRTPRMQKLTTILLRWSTGVIEVRNRLTVADSGEVLREETSKLWPLGPPLLDSFASADPLNDAILLDRCLELGVVSGDGAVMNSGGRLRCHGEDREGWMDWEMAANLARVQSDLSVNL
jgi:hypothetical protein